MSITKGIRHIRQRHIYYLYCIRILPYALQNQFHFLLVWLVIKISFKQRISFNQVWNFWYSCKLPFIFSALSFCQIYYILLIPCFQGQLEFKTDRIRRPDKWSCFGWTRNILNNRKKKRRNFYNFLTLNTEVFRDTI